MTGDREIELSSSAEYARLSAGSVEDWRHRRGLAGIKFALFGGLLTQVMFWLTWEISPNLTGTIRFDTIISEGLGVLFDLSLLVMLVTEILAIGYGTEAWRSTTGKLAILTVCAVAVSLVLVFYFVVVPAGFI